MQWLPVDILRMILVCCAPEYLHRIAAVCRGWKNITEVRRIRIAKLCSPPFNIKRPFTCKERKLRLDSIGDTGLSALATAVGNGALPLLTYLDLENNQIGDAGLASFAAALGSGALPLLENLTLGYNNIGDDGLIALAEALGNGSLPSLMYLYLSNNNIGDTGLSALATAVGNGTLPECITIPLDGNPASAESRQLVQNALDNLG